ncbi:Gfo/Idh/MocA family oxidoreductase [Paenibacillus sp. J5C_2022]|uniref:Gfo/Idh/MocA family protein n=1 Tax=Paenibacillus sp. J5C2022 TaxID=2977129 RepID=UPI0021D020DC|nr:Gfo/Idh/MocA family oxidoreductase [Paenibacillus sp. J5C2022]MCU6713117.1 Gfo/Idh/MocA family oxidoreductase [Paenibacillus sp. J5C2022]
MSNKRAIRWGIMGPGRISRKFASDLKFAEGAELTAVAGRALDKAKDFAQEFDVPKAYGSCEELAADPDIDLVYIGTLHPAHKDNAMTCLRGGKAVLCEKPFTVNAAEAEEMIAYARKNRLFLMEAMWTRYLPPIVQVRQWLEEGKIGEVQLLQAAFGFDGGWNPESRLLKRELGGGALLDTGIYVVSLASMLAGGKQPDRISSSGRLGESGVDERFSLLFHYDSGLTATLHGAVRLSLNNEAWIFGTEGKIHIPSFLAARSATLYVKDAEPVTFQDDREFFGYTYQAMEAMDALREGRLESAVMPLDETLIIMKTMDAIRAQWGLAYPGE